MSDLDELWPELATEARDTAERDGINRELAAARIGMRHRTKDKPHGPPT